MIVNSNGKRLYVKARHIKGLTTKGGKTIIVMKSGKEVEVSESFSKIMEMIKDE